jgi:predicted metal-dependent phosphoesterase TrpH
MRKRHWLKGDCHLHTANSDGAKTPEALYEMLYRKGLDFAFITDHNFNTPGEAQFNYKGVGIFPGMEISGNLGHVNVFGEHMLVRSIHRPRTKEDYLALVSYFRSRGAHVSVNHPLDRGLLWRLDLEDFQPDSVEVWNSPMHNDDVYCMHWWHSLLLQGRYIPAVGGSDYHRDYYVTRLLASPTTYVYAYSNTMEDVLEAIRAGRVFVTNSPGAARLFLTCGEKVPGERVALGQGRTVTVACDFLRRGQTLRVFHNDTEILSHSAGKREEGVSFRLPVDAPGFVRAQVGYRLTGKLAAAYAFGAAKFDRHDPGEAVPEFIYSFTNPIFFD